MISLLFFITLQEVTHPWGRGQWTTVSTPNCFWPKAEENGGLVVQGRAQRGDNEDSVQWIYSTELPPPDQSQPKSCGGLMWGQVIPPRHPTPNAISSCALFIHEALIYSITAGQLSSDGPPMSCGCEISILGFSERSLPLTLTLFGVWHNHCGSKQSNLGDCNPPGFC